MAVPWGWQSDTAVIAGLADAPCVMVAVTVTVTVCAPAVAPPAVVGPLVEVKKAWSSGLVCATAENVKANATTRWANGGIIG